MNAKFSRSAAALLLAAALSMAATPALARDRNWGGGNWGGGWGHRHHDRVDAGDVIAGVLILGGIAAIASAASNSKKAKRERSRDYRYPDQSYPSQSYPSDSYPQRDDSADYGTETGRDYEDGIRESRDDQRDETRENAREDSRGLDNAVNRCASEIERGDRRIDEIETVTREGDGWRISGRIEGGANFGCTVDRGGRVSNVNVSGRAL